jgi:thiol:disulfide interchange protein
MLILKKVLALPLFLTAAWLLFLFWGLVAPQAVTQTVSAQGVWEVYTPQREQQLLKAHQPFFIDFTAKWCLTCQVNKKLVLEKAEVLKKFKQKNYTLIRADWTKQDGVISQSLTRYGRSGVPVYVIYDGKNKPKLLPEILTVSMLLNEIK